MASSDLLSQDEIDALLSGVDSGEVETDAEELDEEGLRSYDFASQDRIVRGRLPTLELINERFARSLRSSLFTMLRKTPTISCEGIQMTKFGEYVHSLVSPSSLNVCHTQPLRGSSLMVLNPKLVFSLVDCFFGGDGTLQHKNEGREFTGTEMRVIRSVLNQSFQAMNAAWAPVYPLQFEYVSSEVNPNFASIVSEGEVVVVSNFHVDLEPGGGFFQVVMPYAALEPIRDRLDGGGHAESSERDARWSDLLREEVKSAAVPLAATLTRVEMTLRDVLAMRPGDIVAIEMPATVVARVDDVPVFRARCGTTNGNVALQFVEPINHAAPAVTGASAGAVQA